MRSFTSLFLLVAGCFIALTMAIDGHKAELVRARARSVPKVDTLDSRKRLMGQRSYAHDDVRPDPRATAVHRNQVNRHKAAAPRIERRAGVSATPTQPAALTTITYVATRTNLVPTTLYATSVAAVIAYSTSTSTQVNCLAFLCNTVRNPVYIPIATSFSTSIYATATNTITSVYLQTGLVTTTVPTSTAAAGGSGGNGCGNCPAGTYGVFSGLFCVCVPTL